MNADCSSNLQLSFKQVDKVFGPKKDKGIYTVGSYYVTDTHVTYVCSVAAATPKILPKV